MQNLNKLKYFTNKCRIQFINVKKFKYLYSAKMSCYKLFQRTQAVL